MVCVPQLRKADSYQTIRGPAEQRKTAEINEQIWPLVRQLEVDSSGCGKIGFY